MLLWGLKFLAAILRMFHYVLVNSETRKKKKKEVNESNNKLSQSSKKLHLLMDGYKMPFWVSSSLIYEARLRRYHISNSYFIQKECREISLNISFFMLTIHYLLKWHGKPLKGFPQLQDVQREYRKAQTQDKTTNALWI